MFDPRYVHNLSSSEIKAWKQNNSGLNGIRTHDLCDTSAVLYQLSYHKLTKWPAPCWLDRLVNIALYQYRRGHGFESRSDLMFGSSSVEEPVTLNGDIKQRIQRSQQ